MKLLRDDERYFVLNEYYYRMLLCYLEDMEDYLKREQMDYDELEDLIIRIYEQGCMRDGNVYGYLG